jgi:hypothetical protein
MPISFQPPQPFDARVAAAYGAAAGGGRGSAYDYAELVNQGTRNILSGYSQAADIAARRSIDDGRRATETDIANYDRIARQADFREGLNQRQRENVSETDRARMRGQYELAGIDMQAQARQAAIEKQAQAQAWLGQQEMSTQEIAKLRQQQNAVGAINADQNLTPAMKSDMILQLRTGIDAGQQRLRDQQAKQTAEETKMFEQRNKAMFDAEAQRQKFLAGNYQDIPEVELAPGLKVRMIPDGQGKMYVPGLEAIETKMKVDEMAARQQQQAKAETEKQIAKLDERYDKPFDREKELKDVLALVRTNDTAVAEKDSPYQVNGQPVTYNQAVAVQQVMAGREAEYQAKQHAWKEEKARMAGVPAPPPPDLPQPKPAQQQPPGTGPELQAQPSKLPVPSLLKLASAEEKAVAARKDMTDSQKATAKMSLQAAKEIVERYKGRQMPPDAIRQLLLYQDQYKRATLTPSVDPVESGGFSYPMM